MYECLGNDVRHVGNDCPTRAVLVSHTCRTIVPHVPHTESEPRAMLRLPDFATKLALTIVGKGLLS